MQVKNYRLPKRSDGLKTFEKIIETAQRLFADKGYQATSINEIINESQIATGTFYLYFDDKLALYIYLLKKYRRDIRRALAEEIGDATTRYEKERLGLRGFLKFANKDPLSYRIIWESMFIEFDLFKEYYVTFAHDYMKQLSKSIEDGEVREEINLETTSYILMGISNFVGLQVLFQKDLSDADIDKLCDNVMDILKNGMLK